MRTAIDSSVLLLIMKRQPGWEVWRDKMNMAAKEGVLLICPIVFAECSQGFASWEKALELFQRMQFHYDPISPDTAFRAGEIFQSYRRNGGERTHLIPDFIIAAHASCQADRFAAIDRGFLRTYFPQLRLL
jgi:predicted nucleic acid-binding protein